MNKRPGPLTPLAGIGGTKNSALAQNPYRISTRTHRRAKRIILKVLSPCELQITLPPGVNRSVVPQILEKHRGWIEKTIGKVQARQEIAPERIPAEIQLPAIGKVYRVESVFSLASSVIVQTEQDLLQVRGAVDDLQLATAALRAWLKRTGEAYLPLWLDRISAESRIRYRKASVRLQRTRWGSCSAGHQINLNARLLLLDPSLVDYVLIHELCHTIHLNHSKKFWQLVAKFSPDYRRLDRSLTLAGRQLPQWIRF